MPQSKRKAHLSARLRQSLRDRHLDPLVASGGQQSANGFGANIRRGRGLEGCEQPRTQSRSGLRALRQLGRGFAIGSRKLLAGEITALRAVPRVDTEGLALKLATLADTLGSLPRKQTAPSGFKPAPAAAPVAASGMERATEALRAAFMSIVSVRRTDEPAATLLSDESVSLLTSGLELELQMARLALLRGDAGLFRASLAAVRRNLGQYFDTATPAGAGALAAVDELARAPLPESLPDVSASLAALLRVKERESEP